MWSATVSPSRQVRSSAATARITASRSSRCAATSLATPEDLLAKLRAVRAQGIEIVNARRGGPGNQPRFYIHDPDGNLVEFYWGIDQVGWEGRARPYAPIEEIDLERFDFAGFVRERDAAAGVSPAVPKTAPTALAD
jgi:catechol 2,3-dioxygenase